MLHENAKSLSHLIARLEPPRLPPYPHGHVGIGRMLGLMTETGFLRFIEIKQILEILR